MCDDNDKKIYPYSPYYINDGSYYQYKGNGYFVNGASLDDVKKYFSQSMFEKAVVLERTVDNGLRVLSADGRENFIKKFDIEDNMTFPAFAQNDVNVTKIPVLDENGYETGFSSVNEKDPRVKMCRFKMGKYLEDVAWMFNPRAMTKRMIQLMKKDKDKNKDAMYVLFCSPDEKFLPNFLSALHEVHNNKDASDGHFLDYVQQLVHDAYHGECLQARCRNLYGGSARLGRRVSVASFCQR